MKKFIISFYLFFFFLNSLICFDWFHLLNITSGMESNEFKIQEYVHERCRTVPS